MHDQAVVEKRGLTGFHLKLIAVTSMLLDHFGAAFLYKLIWASYMVTPQMADSAAWRDVLLVWVSQHLRMLWQVYDLLRLVGRLAFPIYCFLLVQGFLHTRSVKRYALRLGAFALISEIPFDLAFNNTLLSWSYNNVFFTLLIGLLVIWGVSKAEAFFGSMTQAGRSRILTGLGLTVSALVILACGMYLAERVFNTDYAAAGVVTIFVLYVLRRWKVPGYVVAVLALTALTTVTMELFALLTAPLLCFYRGRRGRSMKYFFYIFYPAHLLVLVGLRILVGI